MPQNNYIALIHKKLTGNISKEEATHLAEWLQAAPENQQTYNQIKKIWATSGEVSNTIKSNYTPNIEVGWQQLKQKMEVEKPVNPHIRSLNSFRKWGLRVAAILIMALGIGLWWANQQTANSSQQIAITTGDNEQKNITLSDGTQVWLNENSSFSYPESFDADQRLVALTGEAFFDVARNPAKPFIIDNGASEVQVLGTSFNVNAYPESENTEVLVVSGKVAFGDKAEKSAGKQVILEANQKGIFKKNTQQWVKETNIDRNELAWHTGQLFFEETPLRKVIRTLEKYYGIHFNLQNGALKNCRLTTQFDNDPLDVVMETLQITFQMDILKADDKNYTAKGGACGGI